MIADRETTPGYFSDFYRDSYKKMLRWLLVQVAIVLALIISIVYIVLKQPPSHYYITTISGQIMPLKGFTLNR